MSNTSAFFTCVFALSETAAHTLTAFHISICRLICVQLILTATFTILFLLLFIYVFLCFCSILLVGLWNSFEDFLVFRNSDHNCYAPCCNDNTARTTTTTIKITYSRRGDGGQQQHERICWIAASGLWWCTRWLHILLRWRATSFRPVKPAPTKADRPTKRSWLVSHRAKESGRNAQHGVVVQHCCPWAVEATTPCCAAPCPALPSSVESSAAL